MSLEYLFNVSWLFGAVQAKYELAKTVWECLKMFPELLTYLEELDRKKKTLDRGMERLSSKEEDIKEKLRSEEQRSGKKRRREVDVWLENTKRTRIDAEKIRRDFSTRKPLFRPWWENRIDAILKEVTDLCENGSFSEGLCLDVHSSGKEPLITRELVGHSQYVDRILELLGDPDVPRIGVYGVKGVGKTTVLTHVQSILSQSTTNTFDQVYWVGPPREKPSVAELQDVIARQAGGDLSGETEDKIRAAKLHRLLDRRGKCVIILDGFEKLPMQEVGIQSCRLVLSASSLRDCKKIDCRESVEIKPLSESEAMALFKKKLSNTESLGPEFEEIEGHIVRECKGLPLKIVTLGERLRGVDDINEWRDLSNEVQENKAGVSD